MELVLSVEGQSSYMAHLLPPYLHSDDVGVASLVSFLVVCAPCAYDVSRVRTLVLHLCIVAHSWLHSVCHAASTSVVILCSSESDKNTNLRIAVLVRFCYYTPTILQTLSVSTGNSLN